MKIGYDIGYGLNSVDYQDAIFSYFDFQIHNQSVHVFGLLILCLEYHVFHK